ncbi:MAG: MerR family DNA-binding transcriptional regulator [Synergistaceae bacterium]|jgi:DNA-binding transcriptional MerR regulator|nr:MerR family DNA-binding transcriptional regulator [Synergistaceae bacterium]
MKNEGLLSIGELAKFARVTRTALLHYDHLGLVSSVERGDNNYRYYSYHQIASTNLIMTLRDLGLPLKDIVGVLKYRTPESIIALFTEQSKRIDRNVEKMMSSQKLLLTLKSIIEEALAVDEHKMEVHWAEEESILLGPQIDYSMGKSIEEATLDFYKYCNDRDRSMDLNYPVWGVYSEARIKRHDWVGPDRFYFKMPDAPDRKPEGLYLTGYARGNYGHTDGLYSRLMTYIEDHNLEICGPAYETYPLNEISIADPDNYLIRISITVKQA